MPNKFSHSVVLAHYSSLGLIDLPESQRNAYLNSSQPTSLRTPSTASKAQSTSIKASDGGDVNENAKQRSYPDQSSRTSALPNPAAGRRSSRRRVIIDTDETSKDESTTARADLREQASPTSTSRTNSGSVQRNSKHYVIQPVIASSLDHRQSVNGKQPSQAIRIKNTAFSRTSPVSHSATVSDRLHRYPQPATSRPATTSDRDRDARIPHPQIRPKAPLTQTLQTSANSRIRNSSPADSTVAETVSSSKSSQPASRSGNLSTYTVETRIFNPLLESANFDGFEDVEEPQEIQKITIINPNSTSKVRSSRITGWSSEVEVARTQKDENNHWRQRSLTLDLTGPETATPEPVSSHNRDMSSHGSFDSLSSLSSFNIPILEREHPLRQNKAVASRSTRPSGVSSHFITSNREPDDSYSPSLFDVGSSTRNNSGARHLERVRRDLVPRHSVNGDRDHKADANPVSEAGADSPPDITMYRVRKEPGSPLAQVEMMLQKREEESNAQGGTANKGRGPSRENKNRGPEKSSKELKKNTSVSGENVNSYKHANAKLRKKEGGGFFQRLKGQNPSES